MLDLIRNCERRAFQHVKRFLHFIRAEEFEETTKEVDNALKLRNSSKRRWIARSESIRAVWVSFDVILTTPSAMSKSRNFDANTSTQAVNLAWKIQSVDFVISVMFMKNIMHRMHHMTELLQAEELNIIDAMTVIESTVDLLKRIKMEYILHIMENTYIYWNTPSAYGIHLQIMEYTFR